MQPVFPAGGETLSTIAPVVVVLGIVFVLAMNQGVREGVRDVLRQASSPVRTYLYGHHTDEPDAAATTDPATAAESEGDEDDSFDYSIFQSQGPLSTPAESQQAT